MGLSFY